MLGLRTQNLLKSLNESEDLRAVLEQSASDFVAQPLCEALAALLKEKGLTRSQAIRNSLLNTIYGQQIFAGTKTPSRDKLIAIAFGMQLSFQEADTLLKQQGIPVCTRAENGMQSLFIACCMECPCWTQILCFTKTSWKHSIDEVGDMEQWQGLTPEVKKNYAVVHIVKRTAEKELVLLAKPGGRNESAPA